MCEITAIRAYIMGSLSTKAGEQFTSVSSGVSESAYTTLEKREAGILTSTNSTLILPRAASQEFNSGRKLKDFHKRKNAGELMPHTRWKNISFLREYEGPSTINWGGTIVSNGKSVDYKRFWTDSSESSVFMLFGDINSDIISSPLNYVDQIIRSEGLDELVYVQGAAAKIYGRNWDGLTFVAEFHKVVRMFRKALENFVKLLNEFKRMVLRRGESLYDLSLWRAWLEGRYGWRILLYDIEDIQNLLNNMNEEQRTRVKDRMGKTFEGSDFKVYTYEDPSIRISQGLQTNWTLSLRGSIIADIISPKINFNPVATFWELLPWSFVWDWFVSIGKALDAITFLSLADQYTASVGRYFSCSQVAETTTFFKSGGGTNYTYENFSDMSMTNQFVVKERRPVIVPSNPRVNLRLNAGKVTDLVALLFEIFAGKRT